MVVGNSDSNLHEMGPRIGGGQVSVFVVLKHNVRAVLRENRNFLV